MNRTIKTTGARLVVSVVALAGAHTATAQSLNIYTGQVQTVVNASLDEMTYSANGTEVVIAGKTFNVNEIDSIVVGNNEVVNNTVSVTYAGETANVVIAGNLAPYLTATVEGANVTLDQNSDVDEEITYTVEGTSTNGQLYMSGSYKCTLVLNGLSLTSTEGAAIQVANGKRINVELANGTTNSLADAADGSQKACFIIKGHSEFKGGGSLTIQGNAKHGFSGGEYVELKKSFSGSIAIIGAEKDGMNIDQYLEMKSGTITVSGVGDDGIQVSATGDEGDENDGQVIISGGNLNITTTATAAKGLKCDSLMTISGGEINITTNGGGEYDADENDTKAAACLSTDADMVISGGTLTLKSTGSGGKGIKTDGKLDITGGTISVTTTGSVYTYSSTLDSDPKGIKADGDLTISGGNVTVVSNKSEGIESKATMTISGGVVKVTAADDALNSASDMTISGGYVYALATGNDGIDANGNLYIKGGVVYAVGSRSPEVAIDANTEERKQLYITGGTVIAFGGIERGSSVSTGYVTTNYSTNANYALYDGSTPIAVFKAPASGGTGLFVSSSNLTSGSSYSLKSGISVEGGTSYFDGYYTEDATISGGSSTNQTATSGTYSGSGNGGGGGNPGGGRPGGWR